MLEGQNTTFDRKQTESLSVSSRGEQRVDPLPAPPASGYLHGGIMGLGDGSGDVEMHAACLRRRAEVAGAALFRFSILTISIGRLSLSCTGRRPPRRLAASKEMDLSASRHPRLQPVARRQRDADPAWTRPQSCAPTLQTTSVSAPVGSTVRTSAGMPLRGDQEMPRAVCPTATLNPGAFPPGTAKGATGVPSAMRILLCLPAARAARSSLASRLNPATKRLAGLS